jgi:Ser/Thr protein kinase RdoA (MazF antagonist)
MGSDDKRPGTDDESLLDVLTGWDVKASGQVEMLSPEGIYRLASERGDELILKDVGPVGDQLLGKLAFENEVLLHLQSTGLPVAVPLPDRLGEIAVPWQGHVYTLSPYLPDDGGAVRGCHRPRLLRNYGAATARMHRALATFPQNRLPDWIGRIELASEVLDTGFPIILPYLAGGQAEAFQAMRAGLARTMPTAFQDLPEQLIHRDCHAENLLSCGPEVTGIVDWDHLTIGPRILDVAYFAVQLAKRQVRDPAAMARWLDEFPLLLAGYEAESAFLEEEKAAFPYVLIAVPILFAYWAIETGHGDDYIQTELHTMAWLYSHMAVIRERAQTI